MASSWTFRLDIRESMFHKRFVQPRNRLPMAVVEPSSLQEFVRCVDVACFSIGYGSSEGSLRLDDLKGSCLPKQLNYSEMFCSEMKMLVQLWSPSIVKGICHGVIFWRWKGDYISWGTGREVRGMGHRNPQKIHKTFVQRLFLVSMLVGSLWCFLFCSGTVEDVKGLSIANSNKNTVVLGYRACFERHSSNAIILLKELMSLRVIR